MGHFDDLTPDEVAVLQLVLLHYRVDKSHGRVWWELQPRIDPLRYCLPIPMPWQPPALTPHAQNPPPLGGQQPATPQQPEQAPEARGQGGAAR